MKRAEYDGLEQGNKGNGEGKWKERGIIEDKIIGWRRGKDGW